MDKSKKLRQEIINAGYEAVNQLIKVAKEDIIKKDDDELAADRLKNAAATKKLAIFDAFEILTKIEFEKQIIEGNESTRDTRTEIPTGWAERRAK